MKWKKLLLIGDSNTQFGFGKEGDWASMLSNLLQRKCDVINRGFSGYNTTHLRIILPNILQEFDSANTCGVILMFGSNDSTHFTNKIQHVPLEKYKENVRWIVDYLINSWGLDKEKLILVSAPRILDEKWKLKKTGSNRDPTHFDHLVCYYAEETIKIAREFQIANVDLYNLMGENYAGYLFDGLHLSKSGGELLFNNLKQLIDEKIANNLKYNYPYFRDLDEDAEKTGIEQY